MVKKYFPYLAIFFLERTTWFIFIINVCEILWP